MWLVWSQTLSSVTSSPSPPRRALYGPPIRRRHIGSTFSARHPLSYGTHAPSAGVAGYLIRGDRSEEIYSLSEVICQSPLTVCNRRRAWCKRRADGRCAFYLQPSLARVQLPVWNEASRRKCPASARERFQSSFPHFHVDGRRPKRMYLRTVAEDRREGYTLSE